MVNAFEFFDTKNSRRVQLAKEMLVNQRNNLKQVNEIIAHVKDKVQKNEEIFAQFYFLDKEIVGDALEENEEQKKNSGRRSKKRKIIFNSEQSSNKND